MNRLAVVIIARNEAHNIQRCVTSARQVTDAIHVFINDSTDGTRRIALAAGAQVHEIPWNGFGQTKNEASASLQAEYILSLDADEEVTETLATSIKSACLSANMVYAINRRMYYEGQWIRYSGWYPDWCPRLYHRDTAQWSQDEVHEKLLYPADSTLAKLEGHLNHYSYRSVEDHKERIDKYARLKAEKWIRTGGPSVFRRYLGGISYFFKAYIIKKGFLDGKAGWTIATMDYHMARTQIKMYDKLKAKV